MNPIADVLHALQLISEGKTQNPDSLGGGKPSSSPPVGEEALADLYRRRFSGCRNVDQLAEVLADAREALRVAQGGSLRLLELPSLPTSRRPDEPIRHEHKLAVANDMGSSKADLARRFSVSRDTVYVWQRTFREVRLADGEEGAA